MYTLGKLSEKYQYLLWKVKKWQFVYYFSPQWAYVKYSSVIITQKGLYQIFSNLSFCNKWICWWWNPLKHLLEQTFSPVAPSGHPWAELQQRSSKVLEKRSLWSLLKVGNLYQASTTLGLEPVSIVHYTRPGSSIKQPTLK